MSVLAAIAVFPILTLLLFGLSKAESIITGPAPLIAEPAPAEAPSLGEIPSD